MKSIIITNLLFKLTDFIGWLMVFAGVITVVALPFNIDDSIFAKYLDNQFAAVILEFTTSIAHTLGFFY